ncbi:hypothetical protein [Nonomuraea turcica]|uniref:hypothetical protein n=1 Tax=Nonomuraea sp. G32 TaxID=3067274 RepID=UPI00273C29AC|nr:hypothetical protein [Nonomuraea sp. G32]MDP4510339.1 hypothetical protein [Nonomuraea sp. G32]
MATTAEVLTRTVLDQGLQRWPGATLISETLTGLLAPSLLRAHELACSALRVNIPFDSLLARTMGLGQEAPTGELLGRLSAERLTAILQAATTSVAALPGAALPSLGVAVGSLPPPGQGQGFQPPTDWTPSELVRALTRLGRVAAPDLAALPVKLALASTVAGAAAAMPGIRSTARVGNEVHRRLAENYREHYGVNLTVADRRVYGGFPVRFGGERLSEVAGRDPRLACCYNAWLNPNYGGKRPWVSNRRADIADLGRMAHWEVKPFLGAPVGVLQDTWYRVSYNYVAAVWAEENPRLRGTLGTMLPGGTWESRLCSRIDVSAQMGYPAIAVPMTLPMLSGLVLYAVFSGPQLVDYAELSLLLYLWLRAEIKRRKEQLTELARQADEVLRGITQWVADNWLLLLVILVIGLLAAAATVGSGGNPAPAYGAAVLIMFILNRFGGRPEGDQGPIQPEGSLTTIDLPGVSVTMDPRDLGKLLAAAETVFSGSLGSVTRSLRPPVVA